MRFMQVCPLCAICTGGVWDLVLAALYDDAAVLQGMRGNTC